MAFFSDFEALLCSIKLGLEGETKKFRFTRPNDPKC